MDTASSSVGTVGMELSDLTRLAQVSALLGWSCQSGHG